MRNAMSRTSGIKVLLTAILAITIGGCASGPKIRADADPTVNLTTYHTFGFFDHLATDRSSYSTMITSRLKDATRRELKRRGYEESTENPELLVNFNTNVQNKTDVQSAPSANAGFYGYRSGVYGAWGGYPQDVYTTHYQEGTLVMDMVDAKKKQLVWQAVAQARLTKKVMEDPAAAIDSIVTEMFTKYPVPAPATPST
jgi:hypothetical protein